MSETIFTKIICGDIPSYKIYENDHVYAFLDISPLTKGHTLVIPKDPVPYLWDLDTNSYHAVMEAVQTIAQSHKKRLGVPYVGLKVVGVDVPHAHVHIVPFTQVDEYDGHVKYHQSDDELLETMKILKIEG